MLASGADGSHKVGAHAVLPNHALVLIRKGAKLKSKTIPLSDRNTIRNKGVYE
jgi:hypothetical protein